MLFTYNNTSLITYMKRRDFLSSATTAAIGFSMIEWYPLKSMNSLIDNVGVQLYTLRNVLPDDPTGTLQAIKEAGFKQVELSDATLLPKLQPALQSLELAVNSSHFPAPFLTGNWAPLEAFGIKPPEKKEFGHLVELAVEHKLQYLVFPYLFPQDRGGLDFYKSLAEKLNKAGEEAKASGIALGYHNHAFEFQPMEDTSPFQVLIEELEPGLVDFELDLFWVSVAGLDPSSFIKEHKERIKLLHLKDKKKGTKQAYQESRIAKDSFQPVGAGILDFKEILKAASAAGVVHAFVEQDESPDPLADIKKSIQYLKQLDV